MSEAQPKEKRVLLTVGNCRVREYDSLNVQIERYETYYNPKTKEQTQGWKFKGYSATILRALLTIQRDNLLINQNAVSDLETYLNEVHKSNEQLKEAIEEVV
ncbi:hypothetical protein [Sediminibacillus massiliensis]|uniref:hypothetical protein n=1 Tax=Sediminibacillus massiliensis TaxID=1926277 RepID=UPI00098874CF|nr:hypothetical protein [Sediminibacillus massiliensis]